MNVTYKGAIVNYTVNHYLLNVDDRKPATPADTEIVPGETGLTTEAKAKSMQDLHHRLSVRQL